MEAPAKGCRRTTDHRGYAATFVMAKSSSSLGELRSDSGLAMTLGAFHSSCRSRSDLLILAVGDVLSVVNDSLPVPLQLVPQTTLEDESRPFIWCEVYRNFEDKDSLIPLVGRDSGFLLSVVVDEFPDAGLGDLGLREDLAGGGGPGEKCCIGVPVGDVVAHLAGQGPGVRWSATAWCRA